VNNHLKNTPAAQLVKIEEFNRLYPIGTPVLYWTGSIHGAGKRGDTRTVAQMMCSSAVVWVTGHAACIALSHILPICEIPITADPAVLNGGADVPAD